MKPDLLLVQTLWSKAICIAFGVTLAMFGPVLKAGMEDPQLETNLLNSSESCGVCHMEIYAMWKRSLHSGAVTDPIFDMAYTRAYRETAGEAKKICLPCHAPAAAISRDLELRDPISTEGVTCDFCHSISKVDLENRRQPFTVNLDGIKRGPLADAESPIHGVVKSDLHRQSELCAGCHEYMTEKGLLIFSTYSEWKLSPQAKEGKTCQNCHMPVTAGRTVIEGLGVERREINLHNISGGHSTDQVRKAATIRILRLERAEPTRARIEVEVSNVGSGHDIPTGMPTRKLVLEVDLFAGRKEIKKLERVYQRIFLDSRNRPIEDDHRVMLDAQTLLSDNRLRPGEKRVESFVTDVPREGRLHAVARLRYIYEPLLLSPTRMDILMVSDEVP